jgi:hypothetical protein
MPELAHLCCWSRSKRNSENELRQAAAVTLKLDLLIMTSETAPSISAFHSHTPNLTADAFRYEYFRNPDFGGKLYYAKGDDGAVIATQAFVAQTLIRSGSTIRTLMSERTLLAAPPEGSGLPVLRRRIARQRGHLPHGSLGRNGGGESIPVV